MNNNIIFFSNTQPNLLNDKALNSFNKIFKIDNEIKLTTGEHLIKMYDNYIKPNLFALIIISLVFIFLFIKYIVKKYNEEIKIKEEIDNINNETNENNNDDNKEIELEKISINTETNENEKGDKEKNVNSSFIELNEEYNRAVMENTGEIMSNNALKDLYDKKKNKLSFDEITKIIVEGGKD